MIFEQDLPPDLRVCNCAGCRKLLVGYADRQAHKDAHGNSNVSRLELVAERIRDRPYCLACVLEKRK